MVKSSFFGETSKTLCETWFNLPYNDKKVRWRFYVNFVWKVVELAMSCVSRSSNKRPTMNSVVKELKECLDIESVDNDKESKDSIGVIQMIMENRLGLWAR
ncbi:unnamed protein product [Ilex paraguariensis]|uniref:Uncharacterized protein n=1 Tax=Ilex paraguariensis TaxID=185542 RepID=A0ABC8U5N7_9AQUA